MIDANLTYAAIRNRGITRRFLFCETELEPVFSHETFDVLGFYGFGSGEELGRHVKEYDNISVKVTPLSIIEGGASEAIISLKMQQPIQTLVGFFTTNNGDYHLIEQVPEGSPDGIILDSVPQIYWPYYTQLGDRKRAHDLCKSLCRKHILFDSHTEQIDVLNRYARLAASI